MQIIRGLIFLALMALLPAHAFAQSSICPRPAAGSEVTPPPDLFSKHGTLNVKFNYYTTVDQYGRTLFCFQTPDGTESPTLHVKAGDTLTIALTNTIPTSASVRDPGVPIGGKKCGDSIMFLTSVNMHFHGMNVAPVCGSDEVIHTLVNSNKTFNYTLHIPKDEPPGLYWYHPHVHGIASPAVQGGASGVIEVEGIANVQPAVSGLPQRYLIIRDQALQNPAGDNAPSWDVSVNYIPVPYPQYTPAVIKMNPGTQEFWRVANASADTILDLKLAYDHVDQPLTIVGLDGVPVGSQDGKREGKTFQANHILVPPAGRAEFIVTAPASSVRRAMLVTRSLDTGPAGDATPRRPLAIIRLTQSDLHLAKVPVRNGPPNPQRFENLADAKVTKVRHIYFDEHTISHDKHGPETDQNTLFYVTVKGQNEKLFDPNEKPAITTTQGAVEDWYIANHTTEPHEFHMHQIHFLVLEVNGVPIPKDKQQFYDTFQVPYGNGQNPFPYIKVRMDFRGAVAGDFVYHCHILDHEDRGMMAKIRVLPKS